MTRCEKSTVLFPYFAAWFVDGFLRSERPKPDPDTGEPRRDVAKNESNHEIDLIQIYGLNDQVTRQLRAEEGGLLQYQVIDGEEYPPYLYEGDTKKFDKVTPRTRRPDHRRSAAPALRRRQRHGQPADRVRDDERPLPAGAQPHCADAREGVRLGRRAALPDHAQHPHGDPDQDRGRGLHQPHLALSPEAARRPDRLSQPALVPPELDVDRVQPALSLAQPRALELSHRRPRNRRERHAVQHRRRRSSEVSAPASRARRTSAPGASACSTLPARCGTPSWRASSRRVRWSCGRTTSTAGSPDSRGRGGSRTCRATRGPAALAGRLRRRRRHRVLSRACSPRTSGATPCFRH